MKLTAGTCVQMYERFFALVVEETDGLTIEGKKSVIRLTYEIGKVRDEFRAYQRKVANSVKAKNHDELVMLTQGGENVTEEQKTQGEEYIKKFNGEVDAILADEVNKVHDITFTPMSEDDASLFMAMHGKLLKGNPDAGIPPLLPTRVMMKLLIEGDVN